MIDRLARTMPMALAHLLVISIDTLASVAAVAWIASICKPLVEARLNVQRLVELNIGRANRKDNVGRLGPKSQIDRAGLNPLRSDRSLRSHQT